MHCAHNRSRGKNSPDVGPQAVRLIINGLAKHVDNKLNSPQYEETTWSARSWAAFQTQKLSVKLHRAVSWQVGTEVRSTASESASEGWRIRGTESERGGASRAGMMRRGHAARRCILRPYSASIA